MPDFPYPEPGSVSTGTLHPAHLIPWFMQVADDWAESTPLSFTMKADPADLERYKELVSRVHGVLGGIEHTMPDDHLTPAHPWWEGDDASYVLEELFDLLDELSPPDHYFGAHPGDGADFGWWKAEED